MAQATIFNDEGLYARNQEMGYSLMEKQILIGIFMVLQVLAYFLCLLSWLATFLTGRSFRYFKVSKNVVIDIVIETIRNFTANMRHKSLCPPKYQFI